MDDRRATATGRAGFCRCAVSCRHGHARDPRHPPLPDGPEPRGKTGPRRRSPPVLSMPAAIPYSGRISVAPRRRGDAARRVPERQSTPVSAEV